MFKFKNPVTAFLFRFIGKCFSQGNIFLKISFLSSCGIYNNRREAYGRYSGAIPILKGTPEPFNIILAKKATRFSLHILGSIAKLPRLLVELLVARTEHQGPHSSYISRSGDMILGA